MAGILEQPTPEAAPPSPEAQAPQPETPVRACATCSLPLADGQDWCLECGAAQPGRLGGRPGWRAALAVLTVTGVLVGGAGAAAYAALTTEAQRSASADAPAAAAPQVAQPPVQAAPEADAADEETPSVDAPDSEDADVPEATGDAEDSGDDDSSSDDSGSDDSGSDASPSADADPVAPESDATAPAPATASPIDLPEDAAALYNPLGRPTTGVRDPGRAVDGKNATAWEAPVGPDGKVSMGVVVSLDEATRLTDLEFRLNTPGVTVEVYATRADEPPPDVLDARWKHEASRRDADVTEKVALNDRYRHVLLWVTDQPADTKAAIAEIQLFDQ